MIQDEDVTFLSVKRSNNATNGKGNDCDDNDRSHKSCLCTPLVEHPVDKPKVTKDRAPPLQGRLGR